jgi:hypothetical protein
MFRLLFGVFLASLVLFFFGFLYWGVNPMPYTAWSVPQDEAGAVAALSLHFPERGTYFIPSRESQLKKTAENTKRGDRAVEQYLQGPLAFVCILSTRGRPAVDPMIMIKGYLVSLFGLLLIGYQMRLVRTALPTFGSRVMFAAISGLIASVMILLGDVAWWEMPEDWKLWQALYHIAGWTLSGAVLAFFIDDRKSGTNTRNPLTEELPAVTS